MTKTILSVACASLAFGVLAIAQEKPTAEKLVTISQIIPTLEQLGEGWSSNRICALIDPLETPSERADPGEETPAAWLSLARGACHQRPSRSLRHGPVVLPDSLMHSLDSAWDQQRALSARTGAEIKTPKTPPAHSPKSEKKSASPNGTACTTTSISSGADICSRLNRPGLAVRTLNTSSTWPKSSMRTSSTPLPRLRS